MQGGSGEKDAENDSICRMPPTMSQVFIKGMHRYRHDVAKGSHFREGGTIQGGSGGAGGH